MRSAGRSYIPNPHKKQKLSISKKKLVDHDTPIRTISSSFERKELQLKKIVLEPVFDNGRQVRFEQDWRKGTMNRPIKSIKSIKSRKTLGTGTFSQSQKLPPLPPLDKDPRHGHFCNEFDLAAVKYTQQKLGQGSEGIVREGISPDGQILAIKEVAYSEKSEKVAVLCCSINHPHLVRHHGTQQKGGMLYCFMQKMQGGSIDHLLREFGSFPEQIIKRVVRQVLSALAHLHSISIIHRDVKGSNVLSDGKDGYKLTDLGTAKKLQEIKTLIQSSQSSSTSIKGSIYWMAPQALFQGKVSRRSDIWSLGCLIIEMASARHPWPDFACLSDFAKHFKQKKRPEVEAVSEGGRWFLECCLQTESRQRKTAKELLDHEWLQQ